MPLTPPSFLSRLSILILMILFSSVFLWADEEEKDTLEETEEEATGPLQIKQQTALCSADYYIKGGTGDKEEDRKRKNIGIGEKITFLLVGKPKGAIKELKWNIEGNGFKQVNTEQLQGELKIALTAKDDLEKDATAKIKAETSEGQKAEITINIRIPKKLKKEKFEGTKSLELRVSELEKKLQEIKFKMESQKAEKKSFFKFLKNRLTN